MLYSLRGFGVTLAAAVGAVAAGLYFGAVGVREITVYSAQADLVRYAERLVADDEAYSSELGAVLTAAAASPYVACSAADLAYLRDVSGNSRLIVDAGRMTAEGVQCSTHLGMAEHPISVAAANFRTKKGTLIYRTLPSELKAGKGALLLRREGSFVLFSPEARLHLEQSPRHYAITTLEQPNGARSVLMGDVQGLQADRLATSGVTRSGDHLYATRCSAHMSDCVTTSASVAELIDANRNIYDVGIALSGVFCGMIGFVFFSFYVNNKGLDQQLRRALRDGLVRVVYQPIVELESGKILGAEALARWTDESEAGVSPDVFVRIAEEKGFVGELTRLVVHRVLRDCGELLRHRSDFHVSVNITAADLADARFQPMLEKALAAAKVDPARLSIEITEGSTVRNQKSIEAIRELRAKGHAVHIDDFGTGYSSLAYLQDLDVDALKIDKAFTQSIGTGAVTASILPQILAMAKALHLAVIVEGVETLEQAEYFHGTGLEVHLQGWYYGKPQPLWQLLGSLADGPRKTRSGAAGQNAALSS